MTVWVFSWSDCIITFLLDFEKERNQKTDFPQLPRPGLNQTSSIFRDNTRQNNNSNNRCNCKINKTCSLFIFVFFCLLFNASFRECLLYLVCTLRKWCFTVDFYLWDIVLMLKENLCSWWVTTCLTWENQQLWVITISSWCQPGAKVQSSRNMGSGQGWDESTLRRLAASSNAPTPKQWRKQETCFGLHICRNDWTCQESKRELKGGLKLAWRSAAVRDILIYAGMILQMG